MDAGVNVKSFKDIKHAKDVKSKSPYGLYFILFYCNSREGEVCSLCLERINKAAQTDR